MTIRKSITADTFLNELLNIPKSISEKVIKKNKILERDPISAQGDAKKLKGHNDRIYRVRIGDYRLFYSFGSDWIKLLSIRKRDDHTYEVEIPESNNPQAIPDFSDREIEIILPSIEVEDREKLQEEENNINDNAFIISDLPFEFTHSLLNKWQIPQKYWQTILKVKHSDDILDLPIPDRLMSRIIDNCFPRDLIEIDRSPEYQLNDLFLLDRFITGEIETFLLRLDPEQEKLLDFGIDQGAVLVKGGAGAGKSTLALYRVKRLIKRGKKSILFVF